MCRVVSHDVVSSDEIIVTKIFCFVTIRNNGRKDISTKWLSDLKSGFCKTQFYMNKERFLIGLPFDASDWPWLDASDWSTKKP